MDTNHDGQISWHEFQTFFEKLKHKRGGDAVMFFTKYLCACLLAAQDRPSTVATRGSPPLSSVSAQLKIDSDHMFEEETMARYRFTALLIEALGARFLGVYCQL